ncbi:MAG: glycosyltransferase family 87 protein [Terriglobales bacterium]
MTSAKLIGRTERLAGLFLLALTIINAAFVWYVSPKLQRGYQDFTAFYCGAKMIRDGEGAQLYDLRLQYQVQMQFAPNVDIRQVALPYNHPPFEALLFLPLACLKFFPAYLVWSLLNVVMLVSGVVLLKKTFREVDSFDGWFLFLAVAGFPPVAIALMHGQDSVLLMLLATVSLTLLEKRRDAAAGVALALCLFKFQIALPMAFILAAGRPRLLRGFLPTAAALGAVSAIVVGWGGVSGYAGYVLQLEKSGAGGAIPAAGMPNLHGLIASVAGPWARSAVTMWGTIGASLAIVALVAWVVSRHHSSTQFVFGLATVTAILVSYHALAHDLTLLVPIVLLSLARTLSATEWEIREDTILLVVLYTILWASAHWGWLSPLWCVPVLIWIFWKYDRGALSGRRCEPASP